MSNSNFIFQNIKCSINIFEINNARCIINISKFILSISFSKKCEKDEKEFSIYPIFLLHRYLIQMLSSM